jgi:uncharacterized membrane protein
MKTIGSLRECCPGSNVGDVERMASVAVGGALMLMGLRGGLARMLLLEGLGGALVYRGVTGHCHLYDALGIDRTPSEAGVPARAGVRVEHSVRVDQPPAEVYAFWRKLDNLPRFMDHLRSVEERDDGTSIWVANAILGATVEWRARIINDQPDELIAWESLPGSGVETAGSVRFEPLDGGRATNLHVSLKYNPPLGRAGIALAAFLGDDGESKIRQSLDDVKYLLTASPAPDATAAAS